MAENPAAQRNQVLLLGLSLMLGIHVAGSRKIGRSDGPGVAKNASPSILQLVVLAFKASETVR